ncbi:hypothetical protein KJ762_09535 [bacterium]|nr:hypothetical protein [bacterium]MBU1875072.1 hypothetical protein [bacterium]
MKRKLFTKTIFILALMLAANITSANGLLENQRQQLSSMLNEIGQINEHITQIDSDLNGMNNKIAKLENLDKLSWIKRRRIVKLTEEKSTLNSKRMDYYQQLMDLQNTTHQVSSGMLDGISQIIDSLLIEINSATSTTGRISGLEHLLGLNEVRNWTINASSVYAQTGNELIPKKLNIQDYLSMAQSNQLIRNDLLNLMDDKIGELALMIETAKEEEILQNRLEQFALEMTSVGGEIDEKTLNPVKVNKSNAAEVDSWTYNNLSGNETNRDFSNWVLNTQPGILSSLSSYDYLPIIKSLEPSELPNYIFTLDSLRNYYVTEKQKLLNP